MNNGELVIVASSIGTGKSVFARREVVIAPVSEQKDWITLAKPLKFSVDIVLPLKETHTSELDS